MSNPKYEVIIRWSNEDNAYIAEVPDLPGCMADGESLPEVGKEIEKNINLWIEVNTERGIPIPQPTTRTLIRA